MAVNPDGNTLKECMISIRQRLLDQGVLSVQNTSGIYVSTRLLLVKGEPNRPEPVVVGKDQQGGSIWCGGVRGVYTPGAGRTANVRERTVSVRIFTRHILDRLSDDYWWLTKDSGGHFALEEAVIDALDGWYPNNAALTSSLFAEPLWLADGGAVPITQDKDDPSFAESTIPFLLRYVGKETQRPVPWA